MNALDMYRLVKHPTEKHAYTFAHAYRANREYGVNAQALYYDKIIDDKIFIVKSSATIHFPGTLLVSYYAPEINPQRLLTYTPKTVLEELEQQYEVEIPQKNKVVYIDYIRGHIVYDDGTTLKLSHRKIFRIPAAPIVREYDIDYFYAGEEATYATITGAEILRFMNTRTEIILGYTRIKIDEPVLSAIIEAETSDEIKTIISLL